MSNIQNGKESSNLDGSFDDKSKEDNKVKEEKSGEEIPKKVLVERMLVSTPYSTPKRVLDRTHEFLIKTIEVRSPELLEGTKEDFKEVKHHSAILLTLRAIDYFETEFSDMIIRFVLLEDLDKSAEDMELPILEALEPQQCERPILTIHLKSTDSENVLSLAKELVNLDTKVLRLQVAGLEVPSKESEEGQE